MVVCIVLFLREIMILLKITWRMDFTPISKVLLWRAGIRLSLPKP